MGFATLKADFLAFEAAIGSRSISDILKTSGVLLQDAADIASLFSAAPTDDEDRKACLEACKRIEKFSKGKECSAMATEAPPENQPKQGIFPGDGSFLKALFQLIITLAPLFVKPPDPAPTA